MFISLELDAGYITTTIWSVEITFILYIGNTTAVCGTMCCQSVTVALCSSSSRIECPGLSEMIHNAIGYDALTENKILCYQNQNIKGHHRT